MLRRASTLFSKKPQLKRRGTVTAGMSVGDACETNRMGGFVYMKRNNKSVFSVGEKWRARFMVLTDISIEYYKVETPDDDEGVGETKIVTLLEHIVRAMTSDQYNEMVKEKKPSKNPRFYVEYHDEETGKKRFFKNLVNSEEMARKWVGSINRAAMEDRNRRDVATPVLRSATTRNTVGSAQDAGPVLNFVLNEEKKEAPQPPPQPAAEEEKLQEETVPAVYDQNEGQVEEEEMETVEEPVDGKASLFSLLFFSLLSSLFSLLSLYSLLSSLFSHHSSIIIIFIVKSCDIVVVWALSSICVFALFLFLTFDPLPHPPSSLFWLPHFFFF